MPKLRVVIDSIYPTNKAFIRGGVEAVTLHLISALANGQNRSRTAALASSHHCLTGQGLPFPCSGDRPKKLDRSLG